MGYFMKERKFIKTISTMARAGRSIEQAPIHLSIKRGISLIQMDDSIGILVRPRHLPSSTLVLENMVLSSLWIDANEGLSLGSQDQPKTEEKGTSKK